MSTIGLVANPASGKDIRRLTARASVFDNQEKTAMLRRCLAGIRAMVCDGHAKNAPSRFSASSRAAPAIRYLLDAHHVCQRAIDELGVVAEPLPITAQSSAVDTTRAAAALIGADAVVVLGGDGTNRAFVKGWLDAPLISLSTGTNNAFPELREATTAGAAAGLLAMGRCSLHAVATQAKVVHVEVEGEAPDLALIDAVFTVDRFVGARALDDPGTWRAAMLTQADPAGVGMTSVGGFARPLPASEDAALALRFRGDTSRAVLAAVAPGRFARVGIERADVVSLGEAFCVKGPGMLAFDGERDRVLQPGQNAVFTVRRDGPWVVDVGKVLMNMGILE